MRRDIEVSGFDLRRLPLAKRKSTNWQTLGEWRDGNIDVEAALERFQRQIFAAEPCTLSVRFNAESVASQVEAANGREPHAPVVGESQRVIGTERCGVSYADHCPLRKKTVTMPSQAKMFRADFVVRQPDGMANPIGRQITGANLGHFAIRMPVQLAADGVRDRYSSTASSIAMKVTSCCFNFSMSRSSINILCPLPIT